MNVELIKECGIEELIGLFTAYSDYSKDDGKSIREAAKKEISSRKEDKTLQEVFSLMSKEKYYTKKGKSDSEAAIKTLDGISVEGFSTPLLARFIAKYAKVPNTEDYFLDNASEQELEDYFLKDCYRENGDYYTIHFMLYVLKKKALDAINNVMPTIAEKLKEFVINTEEDFVIPESIKKSKKLILVGIVAKNIENVAYLYEVPSILRMTLRGEVKQLPDGISALSELIELKLITKSNNLPEDIAGLTNLKELGLGLIVDTLPAMVCDMKNLEGLRIEDCPNLKVLPKCVLELPKLSKYHKDILIEKYFANDQEYLQLFNKLNSYARWSVEQIEDKKVLEIATKILNDYKADPSKEKEVKLPELLLAASKSYYDVEHGRRTNGDLYDYINQNAPAEFREINNSLTVPKYYHENTAATVFEDAKKRLAKFPDFDQELFFTLAHAMRKNQPDF